MALPPYILEVDHDHDIAYEVHESLSYTHKIEIIEGWIRDYIANVLSTGRDHVWAALEYLGEVTDG